ncbi:MAG TPA: PHB depolymerase family esterase [Chloroflexota bacterium]|nr:PHB depolymerase family esterase [Chloroflexota bacterium]
MRSLVRAALAGGLAGASLAALGVARLTHPLSLLRSREHHLTFGGRERTYRLHLPPRYNGRARLPLVVMLHPRGDYARQFEIYSGMSHQADQAGFVVAYPNGLAGPDDPARSWNAGFCCGYPYAHNVDDVGFIGHLLDTLLAAYRIDPRRVYAAGWSNGGMLAHRLAAELPERLTAIAAVNATVGGRTPGQPEYTYIPAPKAPVPVLIMHGGRDHIVPYAGGVNVNGDSDFVAVRDTVALWTTRNDCDPMPVVCDLGVRGVEERTYRAGANGCDVVLYTVPDGGHVYFGGLQEIRRNLCGANVSATRLIWQFFAAHG